MKKIVLITGATSGIGKATAEKMAAAGNNIIITGRREERLEKINNKLTELHKIEVISLCFDIRNYNEAKAAINSLPEKWKKIDILINNAGIAVGFQNIQDGIIDDWNRMIDTNIKGILYITKLVSPFMIERQKGHLINIGSIAGKEVYLKGNVYCATKHAVDALSKAMRMEFLEHHIKLTQISPGAIDTEFSDVRFKGNMKKAESVYKGYTPLYANDIANIIHFVIEQPAHVNINDMVVMPTAQASASLFNKKEA